MNIKKTGHIDFTKIDKVTEKDEYYMVKTILNKYYNAINYLNADIEQLGVVDIETEKEKNEVIKQYTNEGINILQDILDKECIEYLKLDNTNIAEKFEQYKNDNFTIKNMYTVEKNINTSLYYINGLLDDLKEYKLIVKTDSYNKTFSIYSGEYIENKGYDENSIENEFNIDGIEYIEKNDNNEYVKKVITNHTMAQYYLYDYGSIVARNVEKAYELLDEEYKNKKYPTLEKYKEYIEKSDKNYQLLELSDYSAKETDNYTEFICKDQYGDIYIFKDTGIMEYKLRLDNYTIINKEDIEQYSKLENKEKVKANINKFFNMVNMGDYELAYELLDIKFKSNYYKTLEDFEKDVKEKMFKHNRVKFEAYSYKLVPTYIYKVSLEDGDNENSEKYNYKILVKLLEDDKFVMSFVKE